MDTQPGHCAHIFTAYPDLTLDNGLSIPMANILLAYDVNYGVPWTIYYVHECEIRQGEVEGDTVARAIFGSPGQPRCYKLAVLRTTAEAEGFDTLNLPDVISMKEQSPYSVEVTVQGHDGFLDMTWSDLVDAMGWGLWGVNRRLFEVLHHSAGAKEKWIAGHALRRA